MRHVFFAVAGFVLLASCAFGPKPSKEEYPVTKEEQVRVDAYAEVKELLTVDQIAKMGGTVQNNLHKNSMVYEVARFLDLLGLKDILSSQEKAFFTESIFKDFSLETKATTQVRNIVVKGYFQRGEPLVVHVSQAFSGKENTPSVVLMFNTKPNIRTLSAELIKKLGPMMTYPKFGTLNGKTVMSAGDYYVISVPKSGYVTASNALGKNPQPFSQAKDSFEKLNLVDSYLRDGVPENNDLVVPEIQTILSDKSSSNPTKGYAYAQLFMYYFLSDRIDEASQLLKKPELLAVASDKEVSKSEIGRVLTEECPNLLEVLSLLKW